MPHVSLLKGQSRILGTSTSQVAVGIASTAVLAAAPARARALVLNAGPDPCFLAVGEAATTSKRVLPRDGELEVFGGEAINAIRAAGTVECTLHTLQETK